MVTVIFGFRLVNISKIFQLLFCIGRNFLAHKGVMSNEVMSNMKKSFFIIFFLLKI